MTHLTEEQLILQYYGDADDGELILAHLEACAECRSEFDAIGLLLDTVTKVPVPQPEADYGRVVWNRIEHRCRKRFDWRPVWAACAAAVLLVAGFLAGRHSRPISPVADSGKARERILLVAVGEHFERTQSMLLELENSGGEKTDISGEIGRAKDLLSENRLYRQTAGTKGETALAALLDELERVLIELSHSPEQPSGQQLKEIRRRIEGDEILFKLRVAGSNIRGRT